MPTKRVLLIEDEPAIHQLLAHVLMDEGYVVDVAPTAAKARQCLDAQRYALVRRIGGSRMVMERCLPRPRQTSGPRPS